MRTEYDSKKHKLTVYPEGEIDQSSAAVIRTELDRSIGSYRQLEVLSMDLRGVSFMDSSGIGLILGRYRLLRRIGCTLEIKNCTSGVERVLRISGIRSLCEKDD